MDIMKNYHDLYLNRDVLLLADVFKKVINNSLKNNRLLPNRYLRAPSLSYDAMFKITKINLEFIPDPGMYIFFQKSSRGGISYISNR